jgi:opacity protein-like surface antigen
MAAVAVLTLVTPRAACAQGFIAPSIGYNFAGDAGCRSATDCRDKNWNWGGSLGVVGSVVGFEAELTYAGEFTGDGPTRTSVTTLMGNFMLAPRFGFVQPYGLVGIGAIRTKARDVAVSEDSKTDVGWTLGGGLMIFVHEHIGLKGDVRYYHSFEALDLLGIELAREGNKVDFGRAGFGVVFRF